MAVELPEYEWVLAVGCVLAFCFGAGLGANDVANTFGSSVGAKALTYKQAIIVGSIMEFAGAVLLGRFVTETVRKGIANVDLFDDDPELFMIGMFCALLGSCIWEAVATYWALPIASTHTIIGGIIGFSLVAHGSDGVKWFGVGMLIVSWFSSPILAALISVGLYVSVRHWVLRKENSLERGYSLFPILVGFTLLVNTLFISVGRDSHGVTIGSSIGSSIGATIIIYLIFMPKIKKICERTSENDLDTVAAFVDKKEVDGSSSDDANREDSLSSDISDVEKGNVAVVPAVNGVSAHEADLEMQPTKAVDDAATPSVKKKPGIFNHDIHALLETDTKAFKMHQDAERYPAKTERLFSMLQIVTAVFDAFAHGANDLANSIAPVAGIYVVYQTGAVDSKKAVPIWIIILGSLGMSFGLAVYGYKVMSTIGVRLAKITPSRGFCIELGAAIVTIVASRAGIPISTTHLQVGATLGVGATETDYKNAVNWKMFGNVFLSWIATVIIAGLLSAGIFCLLVFSPRMET